MSRLISLTRRLHMLPRYIENPKLFALRRKGGDVRLFLTLNKPWFLAYNFNTILDIGANEGQFSLTMHSLLPNAKLIVFEPLQAAFNELKQKLPQVNTITMINAALGDEPGSIDFVANDFTASSSFLKMTEKHTTAFPFTAKTQVVQVRVEKLDTLAGELGIRGPLLVKIDVQGYENQVLTGGEETIRMADVIIVETSFEMLYENQPQFDEIYRRLLGWGFEYKGSLDQVHDPRDGRLLQADSIFVRSPSNGSESGFGSDTMKYRSNSISR